VKEYKVSTPRLLDCTLRDGGYVNNWEFGCETAKGIIDGLYRSGIRDIEIGIMGQGSSDGNETRFPSFEQMIPLLKNRKHDCNYYVMINQAEIDSYHIPDRSEYTPDSIRIAFFKEDADRAAETAAALSGKGYRIFMQAMATFMYSRSELAEHLKLLNQIKPAAFYIVDSFGFMYNADMAAMAAVVDTYLSDEIIFGFHAHNNTQMACSNAYCFFELMPHRNLIADGSIFGMGRGAGNAPIELLMHYANHHFNSGYNPSTVLQTFETFLSPTYQKCHWGYSPQHFVSAVNKINPAYTWYLNQLGYSRYDDIEKILLSVPNEKRHSLSKETVQSIISQINLK
jgi:4-hydroxy 2-oxovalerate aldolase